MRVGDVTAQLAHRWRRERNEWRWRRGRAAAYRALRAEASARPVTFAEKVRHKMAFDRNPLLHVLADKVAARAWIADRVGEDRLPRVLAVAAHPEEVDWSSLPEEYVAKAAHGSGGSVMVSRHFDTDARLPDADFEVGWRRYAVTPANAPAASVQGLLRHWIGLPFEWWPQRRPEWAYRDLPRRFIIEEFIEDTDAALPADVKLYAFNGRVQFFRMNYQDETAEKSTSYFDRDGEPLDVTLLAPAHVWAHPDPDPGPPDDFGDAVALAEQLAAGLDFVRVDLYRSSRGLLVGELTSYDTAGDFAYDPPEFGTWAGRDWNPSYR